MYTWNIHGFDFWGRFDYPFLKPNDHQDFIYVVWKVLVSLKSREEEETMDLTSKTPP